MDNQLQPKIIIAGQKRAVFTVGCVLLFFACTAVTAHYAVSMSCDMQMPGGWTMSMMWMRMPGNSWSTAWLSFTIMWMAMMVAMMMPSALPMFLKTGGLIKSFAWLVLGYFIVWMLPVILLYPAGILFADAAMQSQRLSCMVPLLSGIVLIAAGSYQFSRLKLNYLLHCRSPFGCGILSPQKHPPVFLVGCRQGMVCCVCCAGLMVAQLMIGVMNPVAMVVIAVIIIAEKLLPGPAVIVRVVGAAIIAGGILMICRWAIAGYQ